MKHWLLVPCAEELPHAMAEWSGSRPDDSGSARFSFAMNEPRIRDEAEDHVLLFLEGSPFQPYFLPYSFISLAVIVAFLTISSAEQSSK